MYLDSPPTQAIAWSKDNLGLQGFLRAVLARQLNGCGENPMARRRSSRFANRHPPAARRRARQGASRISGNGIGAQSPGIFWDEDMTHAAPQAPRDAGHGGNRDTPGITGRGSSAMATP